MSWQATSATKSLCTNLTRSEKFLLLILADYHNDETNRCDPSIGRLSHDALMSRSLAVRSLQTLDKKGYLKIRRRREDGRQTSNQYDLLYLSVATPPCQHGFQSSAQSVLQSSAHATQTVRENRHKNRKKEPPCISTLERHKRQQEAKTG